MAEIIVSFLQGLITSHRNQMTPVKAFPVLILNVSNGSRKISFEQKVIFNFKVFLRGNFNFDQRNIHLRYPYE